MVRRQQYVFTVPLVGRASNAAGTRNEKHGVTSKRPNSLYTKASCGKTASTRTLCEPSARAHATITLRTALTLLLSLTLSVEPRMAGIPLPGGSEPE